MWRRPYLILVVLLSESAVLWRGGGGSGGQGGECDRVLEGRGHAAQALPRPGGSAGYVCCVCGCVEGNNMQVKPA
jgi:hypothetical protein